MPGYPTAPTGLAWGPTESRQKRPAPSAAVCYWSGPPSAHGPASSIHGQQGEPRLGSALGWILQWHEPPTLYRQAIEGRNSESATQRKRCGPCALPPPRKSLAVPGPGSSQSMAGFSPCACPVSEQAPSPQELVWPWKESKYSLAGRSYPARETCLRRPAICAWASAMASLSRATDGVPPRRVSRITTSAAT